MTAVDASKWLFELALANYVVLVISAALVLSLRRWIHRVHRRWFDLTDSQIDFVLYLWLALHKLAIWVLFLIPAVVLRFRG